MSADSFNNSDFSSDGVAGHHMTYFFQIVVLFAGFADALINGYYTILFSAIALMLILTITSASILVSNIYDYIHSLKMSTEILNQISGTPVSGSPQFRAARTRAMEAIGMKTYLHKVLIARIHLLKVFMTSLN